jgi:predicted metal-dependent peptidase
MPRAKKVTKNEQEIVDAVKQTLASFSVSEAEYVEFKKDIENIGYRYSLEFPFWGVLSERCSFSLTKHLVPTAGITKTGHIIFNVDFVKELRDKHGKLYHKKMLFLIAHEIAHFAFEHAERRGQRDAKVFNIAADYAINLLLHYQFNGSSDYFIEDGYLDVSYDGMSAEQIYELIKDNYKGRGRGDGGDGIGDDLRPDLTEEDIANGSASVRERRIPLPDLRGKSPEQARKELADWIGRGTQEAFAVAKSQGKLPSDLERAIAKLLKPQIDWLRALKQKLRFGVSRTEKRDVTWSVPNRRFLGADFIMPSNVGPDKPKIVYAIDTSGSMSESDLSQAVSELEEIRVKYGAKVYMLDCDANVQSSRWIEPHEPLPKLKGGGGTDFVPVFNHLIEKRIRPDYCCFFTDGYGNFGDEKPPFEVLWVMTSQVDPPFGEVVRVNVPYEGQ